MTPPKTEPVKLTVRLDQLELLMLRAGIKSNADLARRMNSGITATTVWKIRHDEEYAVNVSFIAGLINAFPNVPFDQLFNVAGKPQQAAA